ncbi:MAG: DsbA family protein [Myxococcota bacterium]
MRRRFVPLAWASSLLLTTVMPGCQGSAGAFASMQQSQASLADNQAEILRQLGALGDRLDGIQAAGSARAAPSKKARPRKPDPAATYRVPVADEPAMGPAAAKVTLVQWSDFQCPHCSRAVSRVEQLRDKYGDDLRIVFKHNPLGFHARAMPAAIAAEAAHRQGKFWPMHDKLFAHAKELTDDNFVAWAGELGLDVEQFRRDLADPALARRIKEQQQQSRSLGAGGTPAFFINGRFLAGVQPVEVFEALIDEEMNKAEALVAKGTAPERVYATVIAAGKTRA